MLQTNPTGVNEILLRAADVYRKNHNALIKLRGVLRTMIHHAACLEENGDSMQHHERELARRVFVYGTIDEVTEQCEQMKLFIELLMAKMSLTISINTIDDPELVPEPEPVRPLEIREPFHERPKELK